MNNPELLTVINGFLLSITSAAFLIIGFFLKDLYKDFKNQIEKTYALHAELCLHIKLFQELTQISQKQMDQLQQRVTQLENALKSGAESGKKR